MTEFAALRCLCATSSVNLTVEHNCHDLTSFAAAQMSRLDAEAALESVCQLKAASASALDSMECSLQTALVAAKAAQKRHAPEGTGARLLRFFLGKK